LLQSLEKFNLKNSKNLLAFSAGVDSSALFFLLLKAKIPFDIALVNYQTRENSHTEESYAINLASKYNLKAYTIKAPIITNNFEKNARDFRYNFFNKIIKEDTYDNLLTAHQLDDQLEWLLMRLSKGAGVCELVGLQEMNYRDNYNLIRPLLSISKQELLDFLDTNNHKYFIDSSNSSDKYERNRFRKEFSSSFLQKYRDGVKKSFDYMREDRDFILSQFELIYKTKQLRVIEFKSLKVKAIDIYLKELGYLLSNAQREEIKNSNSLVIGGIWAIEIVNNIIYISPYIKTPMDKKTKEKYRVAKIPPKIRGYLFENGIDIII
jgi:tRNA(Ile)-lysidine synthase